MIAVIDDMQVIRRLLEHTGEWNGLPSFHSASIRGSPPVVNPEAEDEETREEFFDGWEQCPTRMDALVPGAPWMAVAPGRRAWMR